VPQNQLIEEPAKSCQVELTRGGRQRQFVQVPAHIGRHQLDKVQSTLLAPAGEHANSAEIGFARKRVANLPVKELLERKLSRVSRRRDPRDDLSGLSFHEPLSVRGRQQSLFHVPPARECEHKLDKSISSEQHASTAPPKRLSVDPRCFCSPRAPFDSRTRPVGQLGSGEFSPGRTVTLKNVFCQLKGSTAQESAATEFRSRVRLILEHDHQY
jgi:hypothetical protein